MEKCPRCHKNSVREKSVPNRPIKKFPEYNKNEVGDRREHTCTTPGCNWMSSAVWNGVEWVWTVQDGQKEFKKGRTMYVNGKKLGGKQKGKRRGRRR